MLEALVDNDGESSPVTATMEMVNVKNTSSQPSKLDLMGSSNFVYDCFFRRQEEKLQFQTEVHGSLSHKLSELTGASPLLFYHGKIHVAWSFSVQSSQLYPLSLFHAHIHPWASSLSLSALFIILY